MTEIRSMPCPACPYRRDVPSGVWHDSEYAKLEDYDAPTGEQPFGAFSCHATPEHLCHGWAVVHSNRGHDHELISLRLLRLDDDVPPPGVPLFASGHEAAEHGRREINAPTPQAKAAVRKLIRKHARLRVE